MEEVGREVDNTRYARTTRFDERLDAGLVDTVIRTDKFNKRWWWDTES